MDVDVCVCVCVCDVDLSVCMPVFLPASICKDVFF